MLPTTAFAESKRPAPSNPRWEGIVATCDTDAEATDYFFYLYDATTKEQVIAHKTSSPSMDFSDEMQVGKAYYFEVSTYTSITDAYSEKAKSVACTYTESGNMTPVSVLNPKWNGAVATCDTYAGATDYSFVLYNATTNSQVTYTVYLKSVQGFYKRYDCWRDLLLHSKGNYRWRKHLDS